MSDIRDVSNLAMPLYRNDFFGAREIMSHAGAPAGMERALRTTNISAMDVRHVSNTQTIMSGLAFAHEPSPPPVRQLKLSDITEDTKIKGQTNLGDMNKRFALFVRDNLAFDNSDVATATLDSLIGEYIKDDRYLQVTALDTFSTLSFFVSDIKNWDGSHRGIIIPDWAVNFFSECKHEIAECAKDIHAQLEGNHHSRRFAKRTESMSNKDFDKALTESTTRQQQHLMLKAGERFLAEEFSVTEPDALIKEVLDYHDDVVQGLTNILCRHLIATAADKLDRVLTSDDALSIIESNSYYKNYNQRADKLKDDLLACKASHSSLAKHVLGHIHSTHAIAQHTKEFIKAVGRLLVNAYCFPIPDQFLDKFFEG